MSEKAPFMVFSGTNSRYLAEKICASLDCPLGKMNITHFADGELPFLMKNLSVAQMYFWFSPHSLIPTT